MLAEIDPLTAQSLTKWRDETTEMSDLSGQDLLGRGGEVI